jgi:hypothetical protein
LEFSPYGNLPLIYDKPYVVSVEFPDLILLCYASGWVKIGGIAEIYLAQASRMIEKNPNINNFPIPRGKLAGVWKAG